MGAFVLNLFALVFFIVSFFFSMNMHNYASVCQTLFVLILVCWYEMAAADASEGDREGCL